MTAVLPVRDAERLAEELVRELEADRAAKRLARRQTHAAIRSGALIKPDCCEECGSASEPIEAHHRDYTKPLDVAFLCRPCHRLDHRRGGPFNELSVSLTASEYAALNLVAGHRGSPPEVILRDFAMADIRREAAVLSSMLRYHLKGIEAARIRDRLLARAAELTA